MSVADGDFAFADFFPSSNADDSTLTTESSPASGFDDNDATVDVVAALAFPRYSCFCVSVGLLPVFGVVYDEDAEVFGVALASPAGAGFSFFAPLSPGLALREVEREKEVAADLDEGVAEVEPFLPNFL